MCEFTLGTLRELGSRGDPGQRVRSTLLLWRYVEPTYVEWSEMVEAAIEFQVRQIAEHKNFLINDGEDALTSIVVIGLRNLGLEAEHSMVNGNCDVTVRFETFLWIGEAKIFAGAAAIWHGYLQLTARYATGLPNHDRGGMLLYCRKDSATTLLAEWRAVLGVERPEANIRQTGNPLTFESDERIAATGLPMTVKHFAFPLLHEPTENAVKLSAAALAAGQEAKRAARRDEDQ